jgi:FkbM family methyltransferase
MFVNSAGEPVYYDLEKDEQFLARTYVPKNATVLELGARYGTVSCVISEVLDDPTRHLAVEPDSSVIEALEKNKLANGGKFHIYNGVVSSKKYDVVFPHNKNDEFREYATYTEENSDSKIVNMSLKDLQTKYNMEFDCVVADCEGFLCDFIDENEWVLKQIQTIIYEKDGSPWHIFKPKWEKLETVLVENNFKRIFSIPHPPPYTESNPHFNNVWVRNT